MKHVGSMHPSINAINFISGFMINVSKKKSFDRSFLQTFFIIIIRCHLLKRYIHFTYTLINIR